MPNGSLKTIFVKWISIFIFLLIFCQSFWDNVSFLFLQHLRMGGAAHVGDSSDQQFIVMKLDPVCKRPKDEKLFESLGFQ